MELDGARPEGAETVSVLQPVLVVLNGAQIGERLRLDESPIEIGRDPAAALVLSDSGVGWRHARLEPTADGWAVLALEGSPPTVEVNGMRVSRLLLSADDRVQIGSVVVRFELHGPIELAFDDAVEERLSRDDLTGLLSRRKFELELSARLAATVLGAGSIGLAVVDLDRLKEINDRHGHLVGARMIAAAGRAIAEVLAEPAFACRLGGDEFAIAVPGADLESTSRVAEAIVGAITAARVPHGGESLGVGASGGIAVGPAQGREVFTLLRAADDALLRAKRDGRGVVRR
jgi:two-component system cell cycle response regulator